MLAEDIVGKIWIAYSGGSSVLIWTKLCIDALGNPKKWPTKLWADQIKFKQVTANLFWESKKRMSNLERLACAICMNFGWSLECMERIWHADFGRNSTRIEWGREGRSWKEMMKKMCNISVNCWVIRLKFWQWNSLYVGKWCAKFQGNQMLEYQTLH